MKIDYLLEIIQTTQQDKSYNGTFKFIRKRRNSKNVIGRGSFADVYNHKTDPHLVRKHNPDTNSAEKDKFNDWMQYSIKHNLASNNPHFMRVYNVTKITDKNDNFIYKYDMEKLTTLSELESDELSAVINQHFNEKMVKDSDYDDEPDFQLVHGAASTLHHRVRFGNMDAIKSEQLQEAVYTLHKFFYAHNLSNPNRKLYVDIHEDNIMVRRSPHGFALVITDPFS